ncbi:MAG: hypothetical protein AAB864_01935 [Patescibacteria group bacterium]
MRQDCVRVQRSSYFGGTPEILIMGVNRVMLVCFHQPDIMTETVYAEIARSGWDRGAEEDLQFLFSRFPNVGEKFQIVAPTVKIENSFPFLTGDDFGLVPSTGWVGRGWSESDRFLVKGRG